jgi:hypothetical protein
MSILFIVAYLSDCGGQQARARAMRAEEIRYAGERERNEVRFRELDDTFACVTVAVKQQVHGLEKTQHEFPAALPPRRLAGALRAAMKLLVAHRAQPYDKPEETGGVC